MMEDSKVVNLFGTPATALRPLNEQELRGAVHALMLSNAFARRTIAGWSTRSKKPSKDEMINVMQWLLAAEQRVVAMTEKRTTDGHSVDGLIEFFQSELSKIDKETA